MKKSDRVYKDEEGVMTAASDKLGSLQYGETYAHSGKHGYSHKKETKIPKMSDCGYKEEKQAKPPLFNKQIPSQCADATYIDSPGYSKIKPPSGELSDSQCEHLAPKLKSGPLSLEVLDLRERSLKESDVKLLCDVMESPHSQLKTLRLRDCILSRRLCAALVSALSYLRELDLSRNKHLKDSGVKLLSAGLGSPHCGLRTLRLAYCVLTEISCASLRSALESNPSSLKELDLSGNFLQDAGVEQLCAGLKTHCTLETLRLAYCLLTEISCAFLRTVLGSNPSSLKELDLSGNFLQDAGVKQLCAGLKTHCTLRTLRLAWCELTKRSCAFLRSVLGSNPSYLKELDLSGNLLQDAGVKQLCAGMKGTHCTLETLRLISCKLSKSSCGSLAMVLQSPCPLKDLDLSLNKLLDAGILLLCDGLKSPHCRLKTLRLRDCQLSDCAALVSALKSNPSELRDLDLCGNQLGNDSKKLLDELVKSCQGEPLRVDYREYWSTTPWIGTAKGFLQGSADRENTQLDMKKVQQPMRAEHLDETLQLKPECRGASSEEGECSEVTAEKVMEPSPFTPEVLNERGVTSYSFRIPCPGVFKCDLTGLMFTVTQKGWLLYRIIQWDEEVLLSAGKAPAGPLYDIQCEDAVSQLHLPHCEQNSASLSQGLSVVHFSDDGFCILEPLEVTDTHVVVDVPHLSQFGLIWDAFTSFLKNKIQGQVLLFHRPALQHTPSQRLNVFLLPGNASLEQVKKHQENANYIEATSSCQLIEGQTYSVHCSEACRIQPRTAQFHSKYGPNYHPTFEIRLTPSTEEATVTVQDERETPVWEYHVELTASGSTAQPTQPPANEPAAGDEGHRRHQQRRQSEAEKLSSVRTQFINRVSGPVLKSLLDELLQRRVVTSSEMEQIHVLRVTRDQARELIDSVLRKGEMACKILINTLCTLDPYVSETLQLN